MILRASAGPRHSLSLVIIARQATAGASGSRIPHPRVPTYRMMRRPDGLLGGVVVLRTLSTVPFEWLTM